jgi:hypothetical protein
MEARNGPLILFSQHALERAGERGGDPEAIRRSILALSPRLTPFEGIRVALVQRGHPIPIVRPTPDGIEVITVLAADQRVSRSDTIPLRVARDGSSRHR